MMKITETEQRGNKMGRNTARKNLGYLVLLYFFSSAIYILFVSRFTIPVHLGVDEELYISMAKSFHYTGHFSENGQILNYTCYLYSALISVAYFFYTPQHIMFLFRVIGVLSMLSSVFPVYLLSNLVFAGDSRKVWGITALTMLLPSMTDTAYCMQEVLAYPVVLWIIYMIYKDFDDTGVGRISGNSILIILAGMTGYFIKTYLIFLPAAYIIYEVFMAWKYRSREIAVKVILLSGIAAAIYFLGKICLIIINGGTAGVNHYAQQFSWLFPIDLHTVISIVACLLFYFVALIFYWGVFPCILPIMNQYQYGKRDRKFISFLILSAVLLLFEIVILIVVTEEGKPYLPHKFLYRYFQVLEIPVLCMFMKMDLRKSNWGKSIYWFVGICILMAGYFAVRGNTMRTAIIDAPEFLLIENASRYVFSGLGVVFCGALLLAGGAYYHHFKQKFAEAITLIIKIGCLYFIGFFCINLVQLPYYTNTIASGKQIERDACIIADYLNANNGKEIYYVTGSSDRYEQAVYAYISDEVTVITPQEAERVKAGNAIFITASSNSEIEMNIVPGMNTVSLQMGTR